MRNCEEEIIVGIDEVGRGPVAGPVAVCAVSAPRKVLKEIKKNINYKDSKKMTENSRNAVYDFVKRNTFESFSFAVSFVSSQVIDKRGIKFALTSALEKALLKLSIEERTWIFLDGGLKAPLKFINQKTIIRGDQTEDAIALASVLAKVTRDKRMENYDRKFPGYGFLTNKGYGTAEHLKKIQQTGICKIHRKTFLKKFLS